MEIFFTILIMTLVVSLSGVVTRVMPFQIPLPLMQIAIGALLAWPTFGLHVEFDPELFLVLFIPPLLFADGWKTPTREFIEHGREILGLALALVLVTVVGIGFLIYWIVPGIPLIPAFALAAVLSPTDAVALSGIVGEGRIPKKIMGILQGEALMNDASGLVSLKFAVAVAMGTMVFTVGGATVEFLKVAIGGILAGFVVSWSYGRSMRFLSRWGGAVRFLSHCRTYRGVRYPRGGSGRDDHHPFRRDAHRAAGDASACQQHLGDAGVCV